MVLRPNGHPAGAQKVTSSRLPEGEFGGKESRLESLTANTPWPGGDHEAGATRPSRMTERAQCRRREMRNEAARFHLAGELVFLHTPIYALADGSAK